MIRTALFSLTLVAAPAFAQTADEIAAMVKAIEDFGCVVTAENGDAVLAASGLNEDQTLAVVTAMYVEGLVALEADGSMTMVSENCG